MLQMRSNFPNAVLRFVFKRTDCAKKNHLKTSVRGASVPLNVLSSYHIVQKLIQQRGPEEYSRQPSLKYYKAGKIAELEIS